MATPFEDEVIKFISSKRPLKLAFLAIALLGVLGSAYSTLRPMLEKLQPFAYRALGIDMSRAEKQKYQCAYFSGAAQWDLPTSSRVAESQGPRLLAKTLAAYQDRLSGCQSALGYSPPTIPSAISAEAIDLPKIQAAVIGSLNSFSGSLQTKDRLAYLIYQIGNDTAFVLTQLAPSAPEDRLAATASLTPFEADVARRITESVEEANGICPCRRLPRIALQSPSRQELVESVRALDDAMSKYFAL